MWNSSLEKAMDILKYVLGIAAYRNFSDFLKNNRVRKIKTLKCVTQRRWTNLQMNNFVTNKMTVFVLKSLKNLLIYPILAKHELKIITLEIFP